MENIRIELTINNLNDWTIIQLLLKRLKISFVQKETERVSVVQEPAAVLYNKQEAKPTLSEIIVENPVVWSPYDAYDAANILLEAIKNNTPSTN